MGKILNPFVFFSKIEYAWRVFATALGFAIFGLGGLFLTFFVFPFLSLCIKDENNRHIYAQKTIQKSFQLYIYILSCLKVLTYRFDHFEKLKEDFGTIVVANHPSLLDFVFLASRMPKCDCIVKKALQKNFFLKGIIKAAGYIPNAEDIDTLLPHCQGKLKNSGMLLIFPEGTRSKANKPFSLRRGAANIALRTVSDIRLISIYCDQPTLSKELKWYQVPHKKPDYIITVHQKIEISEFIKSDITSIEARRLTQYLQKELSYNYEQIKKNGDKTNGPKTRTEIINH